MFVCQVFSWIFCTTIVAVSGQYVFQPKNANLRNLVINNSTGEVFVGGENYIYKLNQSLGEVHVVYTPCKVKACGETVEANINQLLMIENLTGTPRLFACGTYRFYSGACITYDMASWSHTLLENTIGVVSSNSSYTSIALQDPRNVGILIASTHIEDGPPDYSANFYTSRRCKGAVKPCIGKKATLLLLKRPKIYYILADIVGNFRYFFSFSKDGSSVARLCESYVNTVTSSIKTYMEMPLRCVGKDGTNFGQLVAAKVVRPNGKRAENFGSTGDYEDAVFIGVFQKSSISSQSAVCTYTFKQINQLFQKNIDKCFAVRKPGTVILNKYEGKKCVFEYSPDNRTNPSCPESSARNQRMIGTIKYESQALVTCSDCGVISSMDATFYRENIVAFLGAKTGILSKFLIYSNSSGRKYESSNRIPGSKISSVNFDPSQTSVYLLSQNKVLKIPVEECGNRTTCESCVKGGDPYCGWCTLRAVCTTYDKCPYYGSPLGYVQNSTQCINVSLHPSSLPLSETRIQKVNLSIVNLPPRQKKGAYGCSVNDVKMPSTLIGDIMECSVPKSAQLPEPSSETGIAKAEVVVYSNETDVKIISASLEFYKCSAISSCLRCTTGSLVCSWCHYKAECSADAQSICSNSSSPWVSSASKHECPHLKNQTLYIPASVERGVTLFGTQLPKPESPQGEYKCTLSVGNQLFSVAATWHNSTSITCDAQQYKFSGQSVEVSANLSVKLGESDIMPKRDQQVQVYLYRCQREAKLCGTCVGLSKHEYKCGWCENEGVCSVQDYCSSGKWVGRGGECSGKPQIKAFSPKTGHIAGNSTLEINGTGFGRMFEDVKEVSIGGLPCRPIRKDYFIAKRIVCITSSSGKSLSAKVKVVISGKVGYSKDDFHYQNPQVDDYEPKIGPVSGGTYMTIYGKELNTADRVDILVYLGPSRCEILTIAKTNITCTTSRFMNKTRKRRSTSNDVTLRLTFNGFPPVYRTNFTAFQYVPDPEITDITPRFIFNSSDRQINVTGSNLNGIHFPKIRLTFQSTTDYIEGRCLKPSFSYMICPLPDLENRKVNKDLTVDISLFLDAITKWEDLHRYPKFNSLTIVPDPDIYRFLDRVHILKTTILQIKGKHLEAKGEKDLFEFIITVGGEKCNITSIAPEVIFCNAPHRASLPKRDNYDVWVNISSSSLKYYVGKLKYDIGASESPSPNMQLIYIILGVGGGVFVIFVILMCCLYRSKKRQRKKDERTYEMQMNSLESKVAKECREAFAELQTDMTDFTSDLGDAGIHFFDFKSYAMRVLFPGVEKHAVIEEKMVPESPKWDEALRTFSQLIGNKSFLLIFVKTLENQNQFKMQDRCNVASLLVIALQSKMDYCTDILQHLLAELIRKSMSKSHPKLLLRRTECIAEKLLTNWLTFTLSTFIKDKAGKPLFMLYKAIRFQVEKGPVDAITNEARYSLSEDKLLRQSIDYNKLTVTVEFEDNPPVQVEVLDTDTIEQTKEKIMEVLYKNTPFSVRIPKDELTLKWVESPSNHTILKDEDATSVREGEWKRLNTLGHYQVPDGTCLRLVRRFASAFDTSEVHNASLPKVSYSPSLYSTASLVMSSKQNISDADRKPWHLTKHVDSYAQEKDDPRHSKLLSEIYLTRLLSTKGTLQQYVDDMFDCIFPTFRKNERPPLPIKFLFDFLDDQARELNITDPEVRHTWKNNSLPLRFWVNLIKNPNFLFDVNKEPIVDSCLSVIAQLFMDACSVSEHILGKDSPSNKLLYAKEIPAYKQKVERFYSEVTNAPRLTEEEVKDFFADHYTEDFNEGSALKELYKYAAKYQDELQEALEDSRYPQLASKLEHVVAIFSDD